MFTSLTPRLIYKDPNFIALDKPAGLLVHRAGKTNEPTLADWIIKRFPEIKKVGDEIELRPGIVHRLDRDTSGIILVARNQKTFDYLKQLFQNHEIKKTYLALVHGRVKLDKGEIDQPISLKPGTIKRTAFRGRGPREAITEYKVLKRFRDFSLLELSPRTGRTHQIRVHLASLGHAVVGDRIYGPKKIAVPRGAKRQMLHAYSLEFTPEVGHRLRLAANLPEDMRKIIRYLDPGIKSP
ncbi:MAG: RluA family pseudouridine synthase [Candidatus Colwellbacteria bacterium]|nr:RluA family pseudouridine synthase [Candidatus Colwellbacteria bacterium]